MNRSKLLLLLLLAAGLAVFFGFGLQRYFSLAALKADLDQMLAYRDGHPFLTALLYAALYIGVTGLSLPVAGVLTLAAGALFGGLWGTLIVSFASTIGATLAFLAARFLFRDLVNARFGERIDTVNAGFAREGAYYLFTLRLVPVFPYVLVNLAMGLTPISPWTYYWVSQTGMLSGTVLYVVAGTQLADIQSLSGIASPGLLAAFALLGVFPLLAKRTVEAFRARRIYAPWSRPQRFDRNLVVVGAGSAGLVAAYLAAALKARVTLVEKHRMGGECLNTGCVPSKALIRSSRVMQLLRRAEHFGLEAAAPKARFDRVMERVRRVVKAVEPHDSAERYEKLGVDVIHGEARLVTPWEIAITTAAGERRLTSRAIVLATGSRPAVPPIPGIDSVAYVTSDTLWELQTLPDRLLVLGGGPIGCEMAQSFARLGSRVTLVEQLPRLLAKEDVEISELLQRHFEAEGIELRLGCRALRFQPDGTGQTLVVEAGGQESAIAFDTLLVAAGRAANTEGLGLEALGIATTPQHTVETDEFLRTAYPNVYACGDAVGPYQFTHLAAHQAWYATVNGLFGGAVKFRVDDSVIPWATFTDPEVARVGLNEQQALEKGIAHEVTVYDLAGLDRAITEGEAEGFVKLLTAPGSDRILGVTIAGPQAGDLIAEWVLAMKHRIGLNRLLRTVHVYPTLTEANRNAAGVWRRNHTPAGLLRLAERYHAWRRG